MCYIDQVCYKDGDNGAHIGKPCLQCNAEVSQSVWSEYDLLAEDADGFCHIDGVCKRNGVFAGSRRYTSKCMFCDPSSNKNTYTVKEGFSNTGQDIPDDCV